MPPPNSALLFSSPLATASISEGLLLALIVSGIFAALNAACGGKQRKVIGYRCTFCGFIRAFPNLGKGFIGNKTALGFSL